MSFKLNNYLHETEREFYPEQTKEEGIVLLCRGYRIDYLKSNNLFGYNKAFYEGWVPLYSLSQAILKGATS